MKLHAGHIEVLLARHLGTSQNVIVPNISWGLHIHEVDLLVLTQSGYVWEIEIKTSLSDLKADAKKSHGHYSEKIKRLYFAVPQELQDKALELIPERAGLFVIGESLVDNKLYVKLVKAPFVNKKARKLSDTEIKKVYELAALRLWSLKEIIYRLQEEKSKLKEA
jgi:hypothetical protein